MGCSKIHSFYCLHYCIFARPVADLVAIAVCFGHLFIVFVLRLKMNVFLAAAIALAFAANGQAFLYSRAWGTSIIRRPYGIMHVMYLKYPFC